MAWVAPTIRATSACNVPVGGTLIATGAWSGNSGVTLSGGGTLALSGANVYTGSTSVRGGTLSLLADGTLPTATALALDNGAKALLNGTTQRVASLSGLGAVSMGGGRLAVAGGSDAVFGGSLTGGGALEKNGTGTLTLAGTNALSALVVRGGTLKVGSGGALGRATGSASGDLHGGGLLDLNGFSPSVASLHSFADTTAYRVTPSVVGDGRLNLLGGVTYGMGSYDLASHAEPGALNVLSKVALVAPGAHVFAIDAFTGTPRLFGAFDYEAVFSTLSGPGGLTKTGAGSLALIAPGTYAGATDVERGSLYLACEEALPTNTDLTIGAAGSVFGYTVPTLSVVPDGSFDLKVGSLSGSGTIYMRATLEVSGGKRTTFSGTIDGGDLIVGGGSSLRLSGVNSMYTARIDYERGLR